MVHTPDWREGVGFILGIIEILGIEDGSLVGASLGSVLGIVLGSVEG
jgi:hypothetical protein